MPTTQEIFERAIERSTGRPIEELRSTPIDVLRRETEKKLGRSLAFVSKFPFIGRGNVLRDRTLSHEQVEAELKKALRHGD